MPDNLKSNALPITSMASIMPVKIGLTELVLQLFGKGRVPSEPAPSRYEPLGVEEQAHIEINRLSRK